MVVGVGKWASLKMKTMFEGTGWGTWPRGAFWRGFPEQIERLG
jgi:hypothetical protein